MLKVVLFLLTRCAYGINMLYTTSTYIRTYHFTYTRSRMGFPKCFTITK